MSERITERKLNEKEEESSECPQITAVYENQLKVPGVYESADHNYTSHVHVYMRWKV